MLVLMGSNSPLVLQDGWTALMFAAQNGHDSVVNTLLERGATFNHANTVGFVK